MRRRTALALAALSCLAPVTGLAAAGCAPAPGSPGASAATPAGSAVPGLVPLDPAAAAPELPTDAPVGRAAFAYALGDRARLVTVDGRQYALAANALAGGATQLSPDGRWLLRRDRLRDLTGTAERTLPRGFPRAWSPTGRWLLVDAGAGQLTVETATGRTVLVRTHGIGVLDDGTVVVGEGGGEGDDVGDPKVVRLRLVDAASGAERRSVTVDTRAVLPGEEDAVKGRLGVIRAWFGPDGRVLFSVSGAHDHPVGLLVSLERSPAPVVVPQRQAGRAWRVLGLLDADVLLREQLPAPPSPPPGAAPPESGPALLALWRDGRLTERFRIPGDAAVLAPGTHASSH